MRPTWLALLLCACSGTPSNDGASGSGIDETTAGTGSGSSVDSASTDTAVGSTASTATTAATAQTGHTGGAPVQVVNFALDDVNPTSATFEEAVRPRDQIGRVSVWYFGHST